MCDLSRQLHEAYSTLSDHHYQQLSAAARDYRARYSALAESVPASERQRTLEVIDSAIHALSLGPSQRLTQLCALGPEAVLVIHGAAETVYQDWIEHSQQTGESASHRCERAQMNQLRRYVARALQLSTERADLERS